jgi:Holliday junction DNA helicase RuvA
MIGKLSGILEFITEDSCIINVSGVGYVIFISQKTANLLKLKHLHSPQTINDLLISTIVKDDAIELYGFISLDEKSWFLELNKVQGVGAKMAQKILSALEINEIAQALIVADIKLFTTISGVGNKLATRIVHELKDSPYKLNYTINNQNISQPNINNHNQNNQNTTDAISALENLGYRKTDCINIINNIIKNQPNITLEQLITNSLRELAKKK